MDYWNTVASVIGGAFGIKVLDVAVGGFKERRQARKDREASDDALHRSRHVWIDAFYEARSLLHRANGTIWRLGGTQDDVVPIPDEPDDPLDDE